MNVRLKLCLLSILVFAWLFGGYGHIVRAILAMGAGFLIGHLLAVGALGQRFKKTSQKPQ